MQPPVLSPASGNGTHRRDIRGFQGCFGRLESTGVNRDMVAMDMREAA